MVKFNGRIYCGYITSIKRIGTGVKVTTTQGEWTVTGGKQLGGSRCEWWIDGPHMGKDGLFVKSIRAGLIILDNGI